MSQKWCFSSFKLSSWIIVAQTVNFHIKLCSFSFMRWLHRLKQRIECFLIWIKKSKTTVVVWLVVFGAACSRFYRATVSPILCWLTCHLLHRVEVCCRFWFARHVCFESWVHSFLDVSRSGNLFLRIRFSAFFFVFLVWTLRSCFTRLNFNFWWRESVWSLRCVRYTIFVMINSYRTQIEFVLCCLYRMSLRWTLIRPALTGIYCDLWSHILNLVNYKLLQELTELVQFSILWIAQPSKNLNSIEFLSFKVVSNIINDNGLLQISPKCIQIFDIYPIFIYAVVPV